MLNAAPITGVLRLTRVTTAFAAVANLWFVVLWTRAHPEEPGTPALAEEPLWLLLAATTIAGAGLYAYGAALNDVVDQTRDRALRRDRPIPSGQTTPDAAALSVAGFLIVALLGISPLGPAAVMVTLLVALGIVAFNVAGKWVPGFGMVLLGLVYAGQMLAANPELRFTWPVVLVMTHALATTAVTHALSGRQPRLSPRAIAFAVTGWLVAAGLLVGLGAMRTAGFYTLSEPFSFNTPAEGPAALVWPEWIPLPAMIAPAALAVVFMIVVVRRIKKLGRTQRAADKITRYAALWPAAYGSAWLFGAGNITEGGIMLALGIAGVIGTTLLRELYALVEHPVTYRR
ncbi:MAG: hypothetical protein AAF297_08280 [Planctomycetota bacterium]